MSDLLRVVISSCGALVVAVVLRGDPWVDAGTPSALRPGGVAIFLRDFFERNGFDRSIR